MADSRAEGARRSSHYLLLRRGVVPHDTTSDANIVCSGFAALRLREQPVNHAKASEPTTHLSPPRFTRGEADESERERAPEAKLQQPASRERSNTLRALKHVASAQT
jgi:hypothetical protein